MTRRLRRPDHVGVRAWLAVSIGTTVAVALDLRPAWRDRLVVGVRPNPARVSQTSPKLGSLPS